jgi:hypothetical protein
VLAHSDNKLSEPPWKKKNARHLGPHESAVASCEGGLGERIEERGYFKFTAGLPAVALAIADSQAWLPLFVIELNPHAPSQTIDQYVKDSWVAQTTCCLGGKAARGPTEMDAEANAGSP